MNGFIFNKYVRVIVCVSAGSTLLTGSSSLQLWSNADEKDEAEGREKQTEIPKQSSHPTWRCIWQSK